jgi:hypothetical protein
MSNNIKVVCRFRPQNALEIREGGQPIINYDDNGQSVKVDVSLAHAFLSFSSLSSSSNAYGLTLRGQTGQVAIRVDSPMDQAQQRIPQHIEWQLTIVNQEIRLN